MGEELPSLASEGEDEPRREDAASCVGVGVGGGSGEAPVPFVPCGEARFQNTESSIRQRGGSRWGEGINLARLLDCTRTQGLKTGS
jgi:hypothetical protein